MKRSARMLPGLLIVATLATFAGVCRNQFIVGDDGELIARNPHLNPPTFVGLAWHWRHIHEQLYVPVIYSAWWVLAHLARPGFEGGLDPVIFHAANLLVHLATAFVAYRLLRLLLNDVSAAIAGTMVFALHPLQVEPVAWAAAMKDLLCGLFSLLAVWQYLGGRRWGLATVCFALALLAKPSAVTVPLIAGTLDCLVLRRPGREVAKRLWPWLAMSIAWGVLTAAIVQNAQRNYAGPIVERPLIALDALAFYFYKVIWPATLVADYGRSPMAVLQSGMLKWTWIAPILIALIVWRVRQPVVTAAAIVFVAALLPVLGLTPFVYQRFSTVADRYAYVAMLGPALAVGWSMVRFRSNAARAICIAILMALAVRSAVQTSVWKDSVSVFEHNDGFVPNDPYVLINLAASYNDQGEVQRATAVFERVVAIKPDYLLARDYLVREYLATGRRHDAIPHLRVLVEAESRMNSPERTEAHRQLAIALMEDGQFDEAATVYADWLRISPGNAEATRGLAEAKEKAAPR